MKLRWFSIGFVSYGVMFNAGEGNYTWTVILLMVILFNLYFGWRWGDWDD